MPLSFPASALAAALATALVVLPAAAWAQAVPSAPAVSAPPATELEPTGRWYFQYGVHTIHLNPDPQHVNRNHMLNLEYQSSAHRRFFGADRALWGGVLVNNSFGQPSQYVYWGQMWDVNSWLYAKATVGLLHGYKGQFRDKIPFNQLGVAPVIIPSLGLRWGRFSTETVFLGLNAVKFTVGYTF